MDYLSSVDGSIYAELKLGDAVLTIETRDIRRERTGIHGRLCIMLDGEPLAWSVMNLGKDEERTRIANQAYIHINMEWATKVKFAKADMKHSLDLFCAGLWEAYIEASSPELLYGDETDSPLEFLVRPFVVKGGGTLLVAPPGRGKSFTGLAMAVSVDAGCNTLWKVQETPTLYINLERSAQSIRQRLARINRALGLPVNRPLRTLNARGRSLFDVQDTIKASVRNNDIGFGLLDSVSRAGFGDLTENSPVNKAVDCLNNLFDSWAGLAHTPRANEEHIYGSIHWEAGADVVVLLSSELKDDGTLGIGLTIDKANDFNIKQPQFIMALDFNHNGLANMRYPVERWEFPELQAKRKVTTKEQVMEYLLDIGKASATEIATETGLNRGKLSNLLHNDSDFIVVERKGASVRYGVRSDSGTQ